MFGFLNKETSPVATVNSGDLVGCFGKMPVHADFIKHNISSREVVALDSWVQDGVVLMNRKYGDDWTNKLAATPRYRFVWVGNEQDRSLAGVIAPGVDKSGRGYPFVAFSSMDHALFKDRQAAVPLARAGFCDALFDMTGQNWDGANLSVLTSTLDVAGQACGEVDKNDLTDLEMSLLGGITMKEFWDEILPEADVTTRATFVRTLVSALHTVSRRTPQRVHWGVRLPLPGKTEQTAHVVFWIQLCESILNGRPWHGQYFWNQQENGVPPRLTVFFRPVPASYFSTLIEPQKNDGSVFDVIHEMANDTSDKSSMTHIVEDDEMLLVDALERWRSREVVQ
jgi:type VI secretion system protein ImpM